MRAYSSNSYGGLCPFPSRLPGRAPASDRGYGARVIE